MSSLNPFSLTASPTFPLFYLSSFISDPCCPPSTRNMVARWCVPTLPPPLRASAGLHAATRPPSVGAAWAQTLPTITLSTTSRSTSTQTCPFLEEQGRGEATAFASAGGPCLWLLMTLVSPRSAGEEDWWTTGTSSWLTRHTSCTTHHRPGGNSGSEYG